MIELKNITKIYSRKDTTEDVVALDDINLSLPKKGFVSILGASGSGKSTLLNLIGGLDTPTSGTMVVDDLNTSNFTYKEWDSYRNEKIGFVLQNCYLLPHLSVKDNVKIKLQISNRKIEDIDTLVDEALKQVGLLDKKNDRPNALSGGQKQRVAIARAIIGKPTVILADEPTGALDSKTGKQIMNILKELSKDNLVVLVTHNMEYAKEYSDRIIELADGKIVSDSSSKIEEHSQNKEKLNKVSIPFLTSLKWGIKNLFVRKYSSLSIIVASSLGLAGVGLILSISQGANKVFETAEKEALSQYPVTITSYSRQSSEGSSEAYTEYTDEQYVYSDLSDYAKQEHYNFMSSDFLSYMGELPKKNYYVKYDSSVTNFNLYTKVNETSYKRVSSTSSLFYKGVDNMDFLTNEYDCLKGKYPQSANELALVVDTYNRVNGVYLNTLGFDVDISSYNETKLTFDEIIGHTYHYVNNEQYYHHNESTDTYSINNYTNEEFYNTSNYELSIVGILREKPNSDNGIYRTGVIYTQAFEDKVINDANSSSIVIKQLAAGLSKNMRTGAPFSDVQSGSITYSASYMYEQALFNLGAFERVTTLYYFTHNTSSRNNIKNYFHDYVKDETVDFSSLSYSDYLERASTQFDGAVKVMSSVLYLFAGISIFVSAILTAILTYISVHQRTNEIGLLRSLGARKVDIGLMVETESVITGFLGAVLSIIIASIVIIPANKFLTRLVYEYNFYLLSKTTFTLPGFQLWVIPIILGIGLLTSIIAAFIPSLIASRKDPVKAINE